MFGRNSKFRHVFGFPAKKDLCYEGFRVARTAHEPSPCAVNPWFAAMAVESSGGGAFIVIPLKKKGRVASDHPRVRGHSAPITDLKWNPFDPWIIASSSEDCTVKLWRLPLDGLRLDLSRCLVDLRVHSKRVTHIEWHPTARDILLSASTDLQCILWNTASASVIRSINLHPDIILSISWNRTGSLFASTCRDRRIRVIDPRQGTVVAEGEGHEGSKASRVIFLSNRNWIFTTGFSRGSQRQMALWDAGDLSRPIRVEDVDSSSGSLIPFFDPDTSIMYLAGKGDGNIRFFEIVSYPPHIVYLGQFLSNFPQCGLGMMPKWGVDPYKCELVRFYKLHSTKDLCEPISMIAPRKSERFQEDIFPATSAPEPALKAEDWLQGHDAEPKKVSMKDIGDTMLNFFHGVHSQRGSDDPTEADNVFKSETWQSEEQLNGDYHHPTQWSAKEDGTKDADEEDAECFQKGMVRLNIGKFEEQETTSSSKLPRRPFSSAAETTLLLRPPPPLPSRPPPPLPTTTSPEETSTTGLKTSSYHFRVSFPNGATPETTQDGFHPVKINEPDLDFADGFTSAAPVRLRQMSSSLSPLSSSSSDHHRAPQTDFRFHATTQEESENKQNGNGSSDGNRSQENGTGEPVTIETRNELDQSTSVAFRSQFRIPAKEFRAGARISRSRSELPVSYRYPFWTTKSSAGGPEVEEDEHEAGMLDFISTEAPDDTLIKPSVLRSSMLTRRRERGPGETALRRTASLREHRTRSFNMTQESGRSMTGKASSGFEGGRPVQNAWGSSTNGDATDKKILKTDEGRKVRKIMQEEVEMKSTPSASRNSVYEHRFQSTLPSFQEGTVSGTNFGTLLTPNVGTYQGNMPGTVSGTSANSASYLTSSSGETIPQTFPGTVQETVTGTLDHRESMTFRSASMERWKRHYERLVEGKGRGGARSEHVDSSTTPKSQENVVMTQLVVTLTPHGGEMEPRFSSGMDSTTQSKSLSSGAIEDGEEMEADGKGNWKKDMWNGKEQGKTETKSLVQRPGWSDENPPSDYEELLSEYVQQRQMIQRLKDDVLIRDRMIQRLEKQLGLLLRQTISLPALSNYG